MPGRGAIRAFRGANADTGRAPGSNERRGAPTGRSKLLKDVQAALSASQLKDGDTISFHHHLRNGDRVLNLVLQEVARAGVKNLTVAISSIFPVHGPLIEHIRSGVVSRLYTSYAVGPVAKVLSQELLLETPMVMQTHGGRARAIESGELDIDVAFVAAPACDRYGNMNGVQGKAACGTLGYAMVDVQHAKQVVAITDSLVPYPACPIDITQECVDYVVEVDSIGDRSGIVSGTTRMTDEPEGLKIAQMAARVIDASGMLQDGFSFQTGAGGISLAVAASLKGLMHERGIQGSFAAGGITGYLVDMHEAGLFRNLFDVQCFDLRAIESYRNNRAHQAMSASMYANPHNRGAVVNQLDTVILGAAEVDLDFNVNVTTASSGLIIGGSGGHSDTAAGAQLAIITTRLTGGGFPKIVDRVTTATTPGETIDAVVTEAGIAVNPLQTELRDRLQAAGLPLVSIDALRGQAAAICTNSPGPPADGEPVALVEYRDGSIIDMVRAVGQIAGG